jgi:hypothetical protein
MYCVPFNNVTILTGLTVLMESALEYQTSLLCLNFGKKGFDWGRETPSCIVKKSPDTG